MAKVLTLTELVVGELDKGDALEVAVDLLALAAELLGSKCDDEAAAMVALKLLEQTAQLLAAVAPVLPMPYSVIAVLVSKIVLQLLEKREERAEAERKFERGEPKQEKSQT